MWFACNLITFFSSLSYLYSKRANIAHISRISISWQSRRRLSIMSITDISWSPSWNLRRGGTWPHSGELRSPLVGSSLAPASERERRKSCQLFDQLSNCSFEHIFALCLSVFAVLIVQREKHKFTVHAGNRVITIGIIIGENWNLTIIVRERAQFDVLIKLNARLNLISSTTQLQHNFNSPCKDIGIVRSWKSLFELFQLKTGKCRPVASLLSLLWILAVEIDVAMIRHWTVSTEMGRRAASARRTAIVRYLLQLCVLWYAHAGRLECNLSIDGDPLECW